MAIKFGPAGNSEIFYDQGHKHSYEMPAWLHEMGLTAYEYSFGRGVRLKEETASKIRAEAETYDLALSVHAPYYINFANLDDEKIQNSVRYLVDSAQAALWLGAKRIVFHPGAAGKDREASVARIKQTLPLALDGVFNLAPDMIVCPETMGKLGQVGDLDETLEFCQLDERLYPCIDFGHLHARSLGEVQGREAFAGILDAIHDRLGEERGKRFHTHFSRIEYTKSGEKRHWQYADTQFGPDFDPLAELLAERKLEPVIICESKGTMAEDAAIYKQIYEQKMEELA